jgi:hypothetical protein
MDLLTIAKKIADRVKAESFKQKYPSRNACGAALPVSSTYKKSFSCPQRHRCR